MPSHFRQVVSDLIGALPQPCSVAEIGVHKGRTTAWIAGKCPMATIHAVDHWRPYHGATRKEQEVARVHAFSNMSPFRERIKVWAMPSLEASVVVPEVDVVLVDADNSEVACYADLCSWWPKAKRIVCAFGYGADESPGVTAAVSRFARERNLTFDVLDCCVACFRKDG